MRGHLAYTGRGNPLGFVNGGAAIALDPYSLYDAYAGSDPWAGYTPLYVFVGDSNDIGGVNGTLPGFTPSSQVKIYDPATENFASQYTPGTFAGIQDPVTKRPEYSSEAQIILNTLADFPSKSVRILKIGYSGTTLNDNWLPGSGLYNNVTYAMNKALAAITAEGGDPPKVAGVVIHLGTNDAGDATKAGNFDTNLATFLASFRTDWQLGTAPVCWARQKPFDTKPYWNTILAAQNSRIPSASNCYLINCHDVPGDADGDIHYGDWGQRLIGARCYKRFVGGRYTLSELSGPSILNPNFDISIDYWPPYNGTVSPTWNAGGKLNFPATLNGEIVGWTANTIPGNYYLIDYVAAGHGGDFSNGGTRQFGVALSANRQVNQSGRTGTIGFKADNSSQGIDLKRTGTAAGASTFDNFTIRQATLDSSNAITNGDMGSSAGWTLTNASISGGVMAVNNAGGGTFAVRNFGALVSGAVYELEVIISAWTSGTFNAFIAGDGADNIGGLGGAVGTSKQVFHANGAYTSITMQGAYVGTVDSIALRRLT